MDERKTHTSDPDGIDRRGFLECMAWVGTGLAWAVTGGVLSSRVLRAETSESEPPIHTGSPT
jgi:hypothetical protein